MARGGFFFLLISLAGLSVVACGPSDEGASLADDVWFDEGRVLRLELDVPDRYAEAIPSEYVRIGVVVDGARVPYVGLERTHDADYKLSFDKYVDGRKVGGVRTLNLLLEEKLEQHLAYGVWRDEGLPAPRTGWVDLVINGREMGLHLVAEQINRDFFEERIPGPSKGALYKMGQPASTLEYMGDQSTDPNDFDAEPKAGTTDHTGYFHLTKTLTFGSPQEIADVVDIEAAVGYLAVDRYTRPKLWGVTYSTNDYYLYEAMPGKFILVPWGMEEAFADAPLDSVCYANADGVPPVKPLKWEVLSERLLGDPALFAKYTARLKALFESPASRASRAMRLSTAVNVLGDRISPEYLAKMWNWVLSDVPPETASALASASSCVGEFIPCPADGDTQCVGQLLRYCSTLADGSLSWTGGFDCEEAFAVCEIGPARCVWTEQGCAVNCGNACGGWLVGDQCYCAGCDSGDGGD